MVPVIKLKGIKNKIYQVPVPVPFFVTFFYNFYIGTGTGNRYCNEVFFYNMALVLATSNTYRPLKQQWRKVVSKWKEECTRDGKEYATLPKQIFPFLLKQLLEYDFQQPIISGFEATGIYPIR